jgi:RecB family exonuclease
MIPRTLSATSVNVAETCLARWEAEMYHRGKGIQGKAASIGSAVHGALEMYVKTAIMEGKSPATLKLLLDFYQLSYTQVFNSVDYDTDEFRDGQNICKEWHKRTKWDGVEVLSVEVKESFDIQTSAGPIPFNYILDRLDRLGPNTVRVMDYKTNAWGLNPADLKKKIQARCYSLAMRIKFKTEADIKIWVEFDMLRHDGPVGISFSKEDDAATYRYLQATAERIIATKEGEAPETLNPDCNFCPRKAKCTALKKNIAIGGVFSMADIRETVDLRAAMDYQRKAIGNLISELDEIILAEAKEQDVMSFESEMNRLNVTVSSRRSIDGERVEHVIGADLFDQFSGKSITMGAIDKLLKGDEITPEQKVQLKGLIFSKQGEPSIRVESRGGIRGK